MPIPLGSREHDVMEVLWTHGPSTVTEVRLALDVGIAYTTVLTVLRNLEAKRAVGRFGEGRAHRYFPRLPRRDVRGVAVSRLLNRYFSGNAAELLGYLIDVRLLLSPHLADAEQRLLRQRQGATMEEFL